MFAREIAAEGAGHARAASWEQLPDARGQPGFSGFCLFANREEGKVVTISLWNSLPDAQAAESRAEAARSMRVTAPAVETYEDARRAARDLGAQVAGCQRPVMASCLLAFGSVVRSGRRKPGRMLGETCARACGVAHGRTRHSGPDRPRHQRQRPNAAADGARRGPRGRGRGLRAICVELLGMQMPGFHIPAMTRAAAPVATASLRPVPPVAASPVATASPSSSGVYPDESGRTVRSAQQSRRARTSRASSSPHGCPGPSTEHPDGERAGDPRPPAVTLSRISRPAINAPAFPGRPPPAHHRDRQAECTDARSTQRHTSSRNTRPARPVRGRP
jgi:heme-degrading monooxygenase HmoA